ncbi:uncharacterized protein LOC119554726 isoform X2 [Drosophila subpulchrella]|uniref:uncharacterized protein LOC119554726 isoform X2 n=1 Tax=Drosophila subpulchrella TaxID=1486046 RepID=UPI0018A1A090|nr:uncharacterized protein LOC119554726 isoform X2 [Drosophila subpulchrella]
MNGKIQKSLADDMASSTFGAEVLIGNWAERRYAVVEQSNAILPGLRHRKLAYQNFVRNRRSCLNLVDHELLKRNFTTTNTLEFQELPRLRLLHANRDTEKSGPPNQPADVDRLQAFGNLTKTHNYLKRFKCAQLLEEISNMQTTYSASFNRPWMSKPIFEYGADYDGVVKFDLAC